MEKNFEFEDYKRDHIAFRMDKAMSGYYRLVMYEPNTQWRVRNAILIIDEPADEDMNSKAVNHTHSYTTR